MCGIAGVLRFGEATVPPPDDAATVETMLSSMPWRGPDARAVEAVGPHTLGHLRLSIIDPRPESNQPFHGPHGEVLVFNGEIYNYVELRAELRSRWEFRTASDTEVILAAYHAWGRECVRRFNGDWAFVLVDRRSDTAFLSRDRFGIKPLYMTANRERLLFASEVRALLAAGVRARMPVDRLAAQLRYGRSAYRYQTVLKGIRPLEAGTSVVVDRQSGFQRKVAHYGRADLLQQELVVDHARAKRDLLDLVEDAVRIRLRADVPIGVFVSGGLDSSTVTAMAARVSATPVRTYTTTSPGEPEDEAHFARMVVDRYGTDHVVHDALAEDFPSLFERMLDAQDAPAISPNQMARYALMGRAAEDVTVMLEGQGGDELFGGYGSCYDSYRRHVLPITGVPLRMGTSGGQGDEERADPLAVLAAPGGVANFRGDDAPQRCDPYTRTHYRILRNNLLSLLHTGDHIQMHWSMEGRCPLLDHRIVELAFSCPVAYRIGDMDKLLLRQAAADADLLPPAILGRTDKRGFATALGRRLREPANRAWFLERLDDHLRRVGDPFDRAAIARMASEYFDHGVPHLRRLLRVLALVAYLDRNSVAVV